MELFTKQETIALRKKHVPYVKRLLNITIMIIIVF